MLNSKARLIFALQSRIVFVELLLFETLPWLCNESHKNCIKGLLPMYKQHFVMPHHNMQQLALEAIAAPFIFEGIQCHWPLGTNSSLGFLLSHPSWQNIVPCTSFFHYFWGHKSWARVIRKVQKSNFLNQFQSKTIEIKNS